MAIGMKMGRTDPKDKGAISKVYGKCQEFWNQFEKEFGSNVCYNLIGAGLGVGAGGAVGGSGVADVAAVDGPSGPIGPKVLSIPGSTVAPASGSGPAREARATACAGTPASRGRS